MDQVLMMTLSSHSNEWMLIWRKHIDTRILCWHLRSHGPDWSHSNGLCLHLQWCHVAKVAEIDLLDRHVTSSNPVDMLCMLTLWSHKSTAMLILEYINGMNNSYLRCASLRQCTRGSMARRGEAGGSCTHMTLTYARTHRYTHNRYITAE